jgi:hypothetical protein
LTGARIIEEHLCNSSSAETMMYNVSIPQVIIDRVIRRQAISPNVLIGYYGISQPHTQSRQEALP